MKHKLSNILLTLDEHMQEHVDVYYREEGDFTSFFTYFGSCSIAKWEKYTGIQNYFLHIEVKSECMLHFVSDESPLGEPQTVSGEKDIAIPETNGTVVAFEINCKVDNIKVAYYFVDVDAASVNDVRLALSTTTFKKEEYVTKNIELVKTQVLGCDDAIAGNFEMFVVDNGRTLDAGALSCEGITILPNPNVGGAGGFARGMMEALASDKKFTHVLLMDDDVRVSPESFKRTFNLLSLANGKYKNAFINGAMLSAQEQNIQIEDVAHVLESGAYRSLKDKTQIDVPENLVANEKVDVEVKNAYGAWWFSCIPLHAVRENGLPVPVFVRCDDVEFGMRNHPTYMCMNGICVWHDAFEGRWRPSVDCYQYTRNFLIMNALDDCCNEKLFMERFKRNLRLRLRVMDYSSVELMLDGLDDYMKGPEFIKTCSGEELMKSNGAKNEKFVPLEELDQNVVGNLKYNKRLLGEQPTLKPVMQLARTFYYDRHWLPDALLRKKPEAIYYSCLTIFAPRTFATDTLVALTLDGKSASIRHLDKERYRAIQNRWRSLYQKYKTEGASIRASYKAAKSELTSWNFWNNYLGTNLSIDS